jgi:hypothetical protein
MRTLTLLACLGAPCLGGVAHATAMFFGGSLYASDGTAAPGASASVASREMAVEPLDLLPSLASDFPDAALEAWREVEPDALGAREESQASAARPPACGDSFDNDGDGLADFPDDPGCVTPGSVTEQPRCQDGIDTDEDGFIDFDGGASHNAGEPLAPPDPECAGAPWRDRERP